MEERLEWGECIHLGSGAEGAVVGSQERGASEGYEWCII